MYKYSKEIQDLEISDTGIMTPVSLLANITVTRQVLGLIFLSMSCERIFPHELETGT